MEYTGALTNAPLVPPFEFSNISFASLDDSASDSDSTALPVANPFFPEYPSEGDENIPFAEEYMSRELPREAPHVGVGEKHSFVSTNGEEEIPSSLFGEDFMVPEIVNSVESTASSHSSEVFSSREDDFTARRTHVTFEEPYEDEEPLPTPVRNQRIAERIGRKGTCYHCLRGSKFTPKEECLVCGAKYCSKCVIRAMGSMPEGRKCSSCLGISINDNNRNRLGKVSKMLKEILPEMELKRVINREMISQPGLFFVNHKALSEEEVSLLLNSRYPPKSLKPGEFWYDKSSGLWGKMGKKPSQIITPLLKIGGNLVRDASKGRTAVLINGREVTKPELRMLQMAGVYCHGETSLWVSPDGSYQQEGMGIVQGKIWDSQKARLACKCFSLPLPPSSSFGCDDVVESSTESDKKPLYKLLMVGCDDSGSTTIFKQARMVYNVPFTAAERKEFKETIRGNMYRYLAILLEAGERFEEESLNEKIIEEEIVEEENNTVYTIHPSLKSFSRLLQDSMAEGNLEAIFPASNREYAPLVDRLWKDPAFHQIYNRRQEIKNLPSSAPHFIQKSVEVSSAGYEPSDSDILLAECATRTKEVTSVEFTFPHGNEARVFEYSPNSKYQLARVHSGILEGSCKTLDMFTDVDVAIFCVSLTDYAETTEDSENKMMKNKRLFERFVKHPSFIQKKFLLVFNKFDLLEAKMEEVPVSSCEWFGGFEAGGSQVGANKPNKAGPDDHASMFMAMKFKNLFREIAGEKLYVSIMKGMEPLKVDEMVRYARDVIKWEEEKSSYPNFEASTASMEEFTDFL